MDFESDGEYRAAVVEFVESLEILPPINEDGVGKGISRRNWELVAIYPDPERWIMALQVIAADTNEKIADALKRRFDIKVKVAGQNRQFRIEDLTTKVSNLRADYEISADDRLAFLSEQAAIARKLNVAKNTIEAQTFSSVGSVFASVETKTPFYLRGYEAIEKEIELIESRENKSSFVEGLREVEQDLRFIEQDQSITRAVMAFEATPVLSEDIGFRAAVFVPGGTILKAIYPKALILILGFILSLLLSMVLVLSASFTRDDELS